MTNTIPPPAGFDQDLLKRLVTQHDALQQMWLSGYLYGIALHGHPAVSNGESAGALPADLLQPATATRVAVLFGSQTGNSKKVAGQVAARIREHGWEAVVNDLNDYPTKNLKDEKIVLLVVSTQGEGDPPAAAEEFHKWLLGPRAPKLDGLAFSVCALGDKSYLKFCQTGREFDERLESLGAARLAARADCDADFEETVDEWMETVLEKLPRLPGRAAAASGHRQTNGAVAVVHTPVHQAKNGVEFGRKRPFPAQVLEKIRLDGRGSAKETWHVELSLDGSGLVYEPGDSLGIYPQNPDRWCAKYCIPRCSTVNKVLKFNGKEENIFRNILQRDVELTVLTREVVEKYAAWTNNSRLKALAGRHRCPQKVPLGPQRGRPVARISRRSVGSHFAVVPAENAAPAVFDCVGSFGAPR